MWSGPFGPIEEVQNQEEHNVKRAAFKWVVLAAATVLAAPAAWAQEGQRSYGGGQGWSLLAGETVGSGANVLSANVGWPGLQLGFTHGATDRLDLGARVAFVWGEQRITSRTHPGLKGQLFAKLKLLDTNKLNLALSFAPGPFVSWRPFQDALVGLELPVGLHLGIPVGSAVMVNFGFDVPFWVTFGTGSNAYTQMLVGGGVEYFLDRNLALQLNLRIGPNVPWNYVDRRRDVTIALESFIGLGYRL